jgi:hypothetical protein
MTQTRNEVQSPDDLPSLSLASLSLERKYSHFIHAGVDYSNQMQQLLQTVRFSSPASGNANPSSVCKM